jgi:hypothetical protein
VTSRIRRPLRVVTLALLVAASGPAWAQEPPEEASEDGADKEKGKKGQEKAPKPPRTVRPPPVPTLSLGGYAKATGELQLSDPFPFVGKARLQADLSGGIPVVGFRAMVNLDLDIASVADDQLADRAAEFRFVPVELRVDLHAGPVDVSVGKQYVFWGQTDWVNPTDLFTPWDYVNISSELEDYRIAPWAVRATAWARATSFDLVWVPWPQPHAIDFSSIAADGVILADPDLPSRDVLNSDVGLRIASRFFGIDASVMAFHGLDKRPGMDVAVDAVSGATTDPPIITMTPTFGTMWAVGGDISYGAGPVLFKGELANYWTGDGAGDDPFVRNPEIAAVLGITVVPHSAFNFTIQGNVNHLWKYDRDAEIATLSELGMPDPEAGPGTTGGLVERAALDIHDAVSIQVVAVQQFPDFGHFEMAFVQVRAARGLAIMTGVVLFGGEEASEFGRLQAGSRGFVEVKYAF